MDERDSLEEEEEEFTGPILINRNTDQEVTNQLINSLRNQSNTQTSQSLMQTGPFDPSLNGDGLCSDSPQGDSGVMNVVSVEGCTGTGKNGRSPYKRSGPDGSPAFDSSHGFLPTVSDNESVVFRPIRQLDFSALDETGSRIESNLPSEYLTQNAMGGQFQYMFEHRQEVYGSHDLGEDSRGQSPANNFYTLANSQTGSGGSDGELDSRVIFSPLRGTRDQSAVADGSGISFESNNSDQQVIHQNEISADSLNENVHHGISSPYQNQKENSDSHLHRINSNHDSDDGFVSPKLSSECSNERSPRNIISPSKRVVSVSIPQVGSVTSPEYTVSPEQHIADRQQRASTHPSDHIQQSTGNNQGSNIPVNAAWEIPLSDVNTHQGQNTKEVKGSQRASSHRKPFVSSVKSDIDSYQPKVPAHLPEISKRDSSLPRPKTKGSDVRPAADHRNFGKGYHSQRPVTQGQGQRSGTEEQQQSSAQERKFTGPIPSHAESRVQARRNNANSNMSNDKLYNRMGTKHGQSVSNVREQSAYQRGQGQQNKGQGAREFHEAARQNAKHQERSPTHPAANVITQVQQYGSEGEEHNGNIINKSSEDVRGMEEVRSQLQNMLKFSADISGPQNFNYGHGHQMDLPPENMQFPLDYSLLSGKENENVSDLLENFPSFTSHMWSDTSNLNRSDSSLQAENNRLREVLEKERFRRKHCEQYIQQLNVKLLETQQQVAVAVSTDKRKDIMIEQLDKQLAKVVEGWKKRDEQKELLLNEVKREKGKVEEQLSKQQEMIQNFEKDMAEAVTQLRNEKEDASMQIEQLKLKVSEVERAKDHAEEMYEAEKEKGQLVKQEWDHMKESQDHSEKKVKQLQDRIRKEQDEWFKREQELLRKIEEVSEKNQKILEQERSKAEEASNKCKDIEESLHTTQTDLRRKDMDLDAAIREKESLKVEMGIMEAKFESAQRSLEADLHSHMEREIAEQIADVQKRMEESENELRVGHRQQIKELNQRYARDMEKNMAKFHEDQKNKEEEYRKLSVDYEKKLQEQRNEISRLQSIKQKLESQRSEILMKLQHLMQSQWNEAVQLLANTPQRKTMHNSFTTQGSSIGNATFGGVHDGGFPVTSSPGKDSTTSGHPHVEPSSVSDLTASLHMQQFIQSMSQPALFGMSSISAGTTVDKQENQISSQPIVDVSQAPYSPQKPKIDRMFEDNTQIRDTSLDNMDHQVHKWLQSSHGPSTHRSQNYSNTDPNQTRFSERDIDIHHQHIVYRGESQPFIPQTQTGHAQSGHHGHQPMAVPIGPPQHGHSQYLMQNQHNVSYSQSDDVTIDTVKTANQMPAMKEQMVPTLPSQDSSTQYSANKSSSYPDPGFSPPTKQSSRQPMWEQLGEEDGHNTDILQEAVRLDADYRSISQRLEQHESRQGELQHYIQMLLNKPPGENVQRPGEELDGSTASNDHTEELDLNDTAQAAQLQRELHRIQELRNKQADSQVAEQKANEMSSSQRSSNSDSSNKVLQPDQLSEITRMLHQYWKHGDTANNAETNPPMDDEQLLQLIRMMQAMQAGNVQRGVPEQVKTDGRRMAPVSPRSPKQNKEMAKVKRNLREQLAGPAQGPVRGEKPLAKEQSTQQQTRKPERKIAPSAKSAVGKNKSAWK